jgi:hypothetical protein
LTLAAVFAFSGAVWANPSTPMLRVCANALIGSGVVFIFGLVTYVLEAFTSSQEKSVSEMIHSEIIRPKSSRDIWWNIDKVVTGMMGLTLGLYLNFGVNTLIDFTRALHNEATIYNNEGTGKSASEPAELKPLGEFCLPSWIKN